jgi:hypothetical protein
MVTARCKNINVGQNISTKNRAKPSKFRLPEIPLGADVGANAEVHVESGLLHQLDEVHQIIPTLEVVLRTGSQPPTTSRTADEGGKETDIFFTSVAASVTTCRREGSWPFQKTYVCTTSRPPSLAFCIRSGHICAPEETSRQATNQGSETHYSTTPTPAEGQLARISGERRRTPCSEGRKEGRMKTSKKAARTSGTLLG